MRRYMLVFLSVMLGACANPNGPSKVGFWFDTTAVNATVDLGQAVSIVLSAAEEGVDRAAGTFSYTVSAPNEVQVIESPTIYNKGFSPGTGKPAGLATQAISIKTLVKGSTVVTFRYPGVSATKSVTIIVR